MSYEAELAFAKNLALQAGEMMRTGIDSVNETVWKADNTPVTETDKAINQLVIDAVRQEFPDDGILGEEASYEPDRIRKWVVDPIDGTQAFDLGAPNSTFCLGLLVDGVAMIGVVNDPFMNRLYFASKGQGAFLNDKELTVSTEDTLAQNYIVISSRINDAHNSVGQVVDRITDANGKYFNFRSVVYGFMRVVAGKAVAAIAGPSHPWDIVAASVILKEAGARVTDLDGNSVDYLDVRNGVIASNGLVHEQIMSIVRQEPKV